MSDDRLKNLISRLRDDQFIPNINVGELRLIMVALSALRAENERLRTENQELAEAIQLMGG